MKKSVKRILSFILTAVMIFALLPVIGNPMVVKAEDTPAEHVAHDEQCSAEETDCEYHKGWKSIKDATTLMGIGEKGGYWYLTDNINITEALEIKSGITVHLCLNGFSITQNENRDTIVVYGTLNLYDKKDNFGKITHSDTKIGGGVFIETNGSFTMNGGTISGNTAPDGGGVYNNGTFTMEGGTIAGNTAPDGGGVYNNEIFTMEGGTISGNNADYSGGVYNNNGTFTMNGGTIEGNNADLLGGGVYNYGTFTMNEGTISGNNADSYGGGVLNGGTFTMEGGTISGNFAFYSGGGVMNHKTFTMNGGTISGNNADYGGGVDNYGTFIMNGGTISGNKAYYGGGVHNNEFFKMIEGAIKDNKASIKGSGVISENPFVKEGGNIEGSIESRAGTLLTVTFNANDGSDKTIIQYVLPNENTNLEPNKFTYVNDRFDCWNTNADGNGDSYQDNAVIKIDKDLVLYTKFVNKISYEVTFNVDNGSWSDGTNNTKTVTVWRYVDENKELKLNASSIPSINPVNGYKGSWDTKPDTENALTENKTYTYTFAPIEYTVEYDSNGGDGRMEDQDRTYDDKTALTTNKFIFEGKTFNGWNIAADGSGTSYADEEVNNLSSTDGDTVTLYAQWTIDTFTITWKDYDGTVLETDTDVSYGTTPTYDGETPKRDDAGNIKYTFEGWTPAVDTVKGAATYTATYSEEEIVEPTEPTEPEEPQEPNEPTEPEEPQEPTEPEVEIPEKDWLDDLRLKLQIANELGGPQTVEYSGDFALSYDIMQYLVEHPDITFVYHVTYEGQEYTITIPAGKAVAYADTPWYGPLWLLANYGGNNAPTGAIGNGTYVVKAGDTLTGISVKLGLTIQYLVDKNGIKNADYIIEGQEINY